MLNIKKFKHKQLFSIILNILHLENLKVKADFDDPDQFCEGFDYVLTGGKIAVRDDRWTNTGSGEVLVRK